MKITVFTPPFSTFFFLSNCFHFCFLLFSFFFLFTLHAAVVTHPHQSNIKTHSNYITTLSASLRLVQTFIPNKHIPRFPSPAVHLPIFHLITHSPHAFPLSHSPSPPPPPSPLTSLPISSPCVILET